MQAFETSRAGAFIAAALILLHVSGALSGIDAIASERPRTDSQYFSEDHSTESMQDEGISETRAQGTVDTDQGGVGLDAVYPVWINATCTNLTDSQAIEIDGVNQTTPVILYWDDGSMHFLRIYVDPSPMGCSYCKFNSWENGSKALTRTIVATGPLPIHAQFDDYYEVSVSTNYQLTESLGVSFSFWDEDIIIYPGPDLIVGYVRKGLHSTYSPTPQIGALSLKTYFFRYWIIDQSGPQLNTTDNPVDFDMVTCTWAIAYFEPGSTIMVDITTNVGPLLVGHDADPLSPDPVSFRSEQGTIHIIRTVSPQDRDGTRYEFVQWLGGPTTLNWTVTLPVEDRWVYSAEFASSMRYVSVQENLSCGGQMSHVSGWYPEGMLLNITWTPPGSPPFGEKDVFFRWIGTGNGSYTGRQFVATVKVNGPIEETAECLCLRSNNTDITPKSEGEANGVNPWREDPTAQRYLPDRIWIAASCEPLCLPKPCR